MKKIILSLIFVLLPILLTAQGGRPHPEDLSDEELVRMQTRDMATWLGLEGDIRKTFLDTYGAFRNEINVLAKSARPSERIEDEEEIDKAIQKNFMVSEKILEIRKRYYTEFKKFLKPSQIRQMYRFEKEAGRRMQGFHGGPPPEPRH